MENNDLISRSDVLELMEVDFRYEQCNQVSDYVENIPAVDAAPVVHGRWKGLDYTWECNKCHAQINRRLFSCNMHYCPNCGARMDGKEPTHE